MAFLLNMDGSVAQFLVKDGGGNESIGHLELVIVPSFVPGTRCGDLMFVMDEQKSAAAPEQSAAELLQQARLTP